MNECYIAINFSNSPLDLGLEKNPTTSKALGFKSKLIWKNSMQPWLPHGLSMCLYEAQIYILSIRQKAVCIIRDYLPTPLF